MRASEYEGARVLASLLVAVVVSACPSPAPEAVDAPDAPDAAVSELADDVARVDTAYEVDAADGVDDSSTARWQVVQRALDEAVLAVWGNSATDVWMVGADKGHGPLVLQGDGASWTRRETGTQGDLWWVTGPCPERRFLVGQDMTVLVADAATSSFTRLETPT